MSSKAILRIFRPHGNIICRLESRAVTCLDPFRVAVISAKEERHFVFLLVDRGEVRFHDQ